MRRTGFVYSPVYLKHDTETHPENPARLTAIINRIEKERLKDALIHISPIEASEEQISLIHDKEYIHSVEKACKSLADRNSITDRFASLTTSLDADTVISEDSYEAALFAAGGVISGIDSIFEGKTDAVFCAVRPPGHHAEMGKAMGFCLFNNVAIGAKYAQKRYGIKRVFIADWDLHHGNGTQNAFYNDPTVFYASAHRQYIFPGTGRADEIGEGAGKGFNMNIPLSGGQGDIEYTSIFEKRIYPAIIKYEPDLIMLSAGFDAHYDDPLGDMNLTAEGFGKLTDIICKAADEICKGRIVSVLEGGYNLEALEESVVFHLKSLMGRTDEHK